MARQLELVVEADDRFGAWGSRKSFPGNKAAWKRFAGSDGLDALEALRSDEIEFHGTKIPANSWVLFAAAGSNRDPAVFEDPDRFDPDRSQPPNLVFGRGPKSCPGIHLAKKNMSVALEVLSQRMPDLELIDPMEAAPRRTVLRCPSSLLVRRTG